jgi:hypothetical protein
MRQAAVSILCLLITLSACRNAPAEEREELRHQVGVTPVSEHAAMRVRLTRILVGDNDTPREGDPHMRATAAQGLGNIGDPDDTDLLLETLTGPLADDSLQVRMECAIALGKLYYELPRDDRRTRVIAALRQRIAFERDSSGRLAEPEFMVRVAMLNSLIALGRSDAAIAVRDVALRLHSDMNSADGSVLASSSDRGLIDRCIEGLCALTGTSPREAAKDRVERDDVGEHLNTFWIEPIRQMSDR